VAGMKTTNDHAEPTKSRTLKKKWGKIYKQTRSIQNRHDQYKTNQHRFWI